MQVTPNGFFTNQIKLRDSVYLLHNEDFELEANNVKTVTLELVYDDKYSSVCIEDIICETCFYTGCNNFANSFENTWQPVRFKKANTF